MLIFGEKFIQIDKSDLLGYFKKLSTYFICKWPFLIRASKASNLFINLKNCIWQNTSKLSRNFARHGCLLSYCWKVLKGYKNVKISFTAFK